MLLDIPSDLATKRPRAVWECRVRRASPANWTNSPYSPTLYLNSAQALEATSNLQQLIGSNLRIRGRVSGGRERGAITTASRPSPRPAPVCCGFGEDSRPAVCFPAYDYSCEAASGYCL
jgi:hypothetical protein